MVPALARRLAALSVFAPVVACSSLGVPGTGASEPSDSGSAPALDDGGSAPDPRPDATSPEASADDAGTSPIMTVEAGTFGISSALTLSATHAAAGQTLTGTVTYTNATSAVVVIQQVAIAARPPGGTHSGGPFDDFQPYAPMAMVQPGTTLAITASRAFTAADPTGTWDVYPTYEDGSGTWHDGPGVMLPVGTAVSGGGGSDGGGPPLVTGPLAGATPGTWQSGDLTAAGMSMHYNFLLPYGYSTAGRYPVLLWLHENDMGDDFYNGGDPLSIAEYIDGWFNTEGFRSAYPCIVIAPYANQNSDPSGETSNFGGWTPPGDHGPNEDAAVAIAQYFVQSYSAYPQKVYVTGASLGGIGSWAMMLDYNAQNGSFGKVFAAGMPFAGVIERYGFGVNPPPSVITEMQSVPVFAVHGSGDTTSQPNWDRAMWQDYGGSASYPGDPGAQAPNGAFHYLEDPSLGHDVWDTYYPLPAGKPLYDWLFSQTGP